MGSLLTTTLLPASFSEFDFESGASTEQQADDPFMIFEGFILRGFPL